MNANPATYDPLQGPWKHQGEHPFSDAQKQSAPAKLTEAPQRH